MVILDENLVTLARNIINDKKNIWNEHIPSIKFDKDGRCEITRLPSITPTIIKENLLSISRNPVFLGCFNEYLAKKGYKLQTINGEYYSDINSFLSLNPQDFIDNIFHIEDIKTGKQINIKATKVLDGANKIWSQLIPVYNELTEEIKNMRKSGIGFENSDMKVLSSDKKEISKSNLAILYDELLNNNSSENVLYLSINPLDHLVASGGESKMGGNLNPTKFKSCLQTHIFYDEDQRLVAGKSSTYSQPNLLWLIASMCNKGILFTKNGNKLDISKDFSLFGYKDRTHVWLDSKGIWLEQLYPSKSEDRLLEWGEALEKVSIPVIKNDTVNELEAFNIYDSKKIKEYISEGSKYNKRIFLDKVAINPNNNSLHFLKYGRAEYEYLNSDFFPERIY